MLQEAIGLKEPALTEQVPFLFCLIFFSNSFFFCFFFLNADAELQQLQDVERTGAQMASHLATRNFRDAIAAFTGAPHHVKSNDSMRFALMDTHFRMERFDEVVRESHEVLALDLDKVNICSPPSLPPLTRLFLKDYRAHGLRLQVMAQLYTSSTPPIADLRATLVEALSLARPKSPDRAAIIEAQVSLDMVVAFFFS